MKIATSTKGDAVILERGEELFQMLEEYALSSHHPSAWLQSGVGGAENVTLSFYDLETQEYIDKLFAEPLEILSLQGNLTWVDTAPFWHVHGIFGTRDYSTIGGHIKQMTVALTGELYITHLPTPLTRQYDETTGLQLIDQLTASKEHIT